MKKRLVGLAFLSFTSVGQAALIQCTAGGSAEATVLLNGVNQGDVTFTCANQGAPGDSIFFNAVRLNITGAMFWRPAVSLTM